MVYQGLRPDTFRYLEALDANNTREGLKPIAMLMSVTGWPPASI